MYVAAERLQALYDAAARPLARVAAVPQTTSTGPPHPPQKTFEFSITSSLKGLSDVIRERFSHSQVLQDTQAELEAKVGAAH